MFWEQYRRTAIYVQLLILAVVAFVIYRGVFWPQAIAIVVVMEVAAFVGAAWGVRLKRKAGDPTLLRPRSTKF